MFDNLKLFGGDTAFEIASAYVSSTLSSAYVNGHDSGIGDTSLDPEGTPADVNWVAVVPPIADYPGKALCSDGIRVRLC